MARNGLFLISIGFIIFLFSVNRQTLHYDIFSMATAIFLIVLGAYFFFKGRKKEEAEKKASEKEKK